MLGEFQTLLKYARELEFEEEPKYDYIKNTFENLFKSNNFFYDCNFDWNFKRTKYPFFPEEPLIKPQIEQR